MFTTRSRADDANDVIADDSRVPNPGVTSPVDVMDTRLPARTSLAALNCMPRFCRPQQQAKCQCVSHSPTTHHTPLRSLAFANRSLLCQQSVHSCTPRCAKSHPLQTYQISATERHIAIHANVCCHAESAVDTNPRRRRLKDTRTTSKLDARLWLLRQAHARKAYRNLTKRPLLRHRAPYVTLVRATATINKSSHAEKRES
jgi:hypothetical protein